MTNGPLGARLSEDPGVSGGPVGARLSEPEGPGFLSRPSHFLAGVQDIADIPAKAFGDIVFFGPGGAVEFLSPEEARQRRAPGTPREQRPGLPGQALGPSEGIAGKGFRVAGQTAALGPMLGRAAGLAAAPPRMTAGGTVGERVAAAPGNLQKGIQQVVHEAGRTFARAPVAATAVETGLGLTAGAAGGAAGQMFPDSDAAVFVGEVIGGTAPSLIPQTVAVRGSQYLMNLVRRPFTAPGAMRRAAGRAQRAAPPKLAAQAIEQLDAPTTIDPETGEEILTPLARTEEPGLLALQRSIIESSESLTHEFNDNVARANEVIQQSLRGLGDAPIGAADVPIEEAQRQLRRLLQDRVEISAQRVDERIRALGPDVSRERVNEIAREELQAAFDAARTQQKELYAVIPETTAVPFERTQEAYERFVRQLGGAQQEDIPAKAKQFLSEGSKDYFGGNRPPGVSAGETTILELRALQSKLSQVSRNARKAGEHQNLNMARIADSLGDAIDDDLAHAAAGPEVADALEVAVNFTRDMKQRFNQGAVGRILGRRGTGEEIVRPGLTLEESIGVTGPKARESLDQLTRAFDSPEAPGSELLIGATQHYMRHRFLKSAVERGKLNMRAAERFVSDNEEILNRMPSLRQEFEDAIDSGNLLALRERQQARVNLDNPRVSKATMLMQRGPVDTFREIAKMKPRPAAAEVQKLVNRMANDETGEALEGLKAGFMEFLLSAGRQNARDISGRRLLSGFAMRDLLEEAGTSAAARKLFTADERRRLDILIKDLTRLERQRGAGLPAEGIIGDKPGQVVDVLARLTGAAVGRTQMMRMGGGPTIQAPAIMSDRFRQMVRSGVSDPAGDLIKASIKDETLLRELLQARLDEAGRLPEPAVRRLNAWVAAVMAERGGVFEEEQEPEMEEVLF